jgi:phosphatidate cytidylyltransferase
MNGTLARLAVFLIGLPAIGAIVVFVPFFNNSGIALLICGFAGLGGIEAARLFPEGRSKTAMAAGFLGGFLVPAAEYFSWLGLPGLSAVPPGNGAAAAIAMLSLVYLGIEAFSPKNRIEAILPRITSRFLPLLYPGLLAAFMVRIGAHGNGQALYFVFFAICFGNDSIAWASGMLFGRKRGIVAVSPNKSVAGFIGGFIASAAAGAAAKLISPDSFNGSIAQWTILGALTGIAVIVGDLAESGLKRSAGIKDSGSIVPGRGGVLDSIDSLLFAAPVFCLIIWAFSPGGAA